MRKDEVPQDQGILENYKEVVYAVDDQGRYMPVPSKGWSAKTEANELAWAGINLKIEKTRRMVLERYATVFKTTADRLKTMDD